MKTHRKVLHNSHLSQGRMNQKAFFIHKESSLIFLLVGVLVLNFASGYNQTLADQHTDILNKLKGINPNVTDQEATRIQNNFEIMKRTNPNLTIEDFMGKPVNSSQEEDNSDVAAFFFLGMLGFIAIMILLVVSHG